MRCSFSANDFVQNEANQRQLLSINARLRSAVDRASSTTDRRPFVVRQRHAAGVVRDQHKLGRPWDHMKALIMWNVLCCDFLF